MSVGFFTWQTLPGPSYLLVTAGQALEKATMNRTDMVLTSLSLQSWEDIDGKGSLVRQGQS